jgi:hypothetical protein
MATLVDVLRVVKKAPEDLDLHRGLAWAFAGGL